MPLGINNYDTAELQGRNVANANSVNIVSPDPVLQGLMINLDAGNYVSYEKSGTIWNDLSGNGYTATLRNGPTFSLDGVGSIAFDGANDYADTVSLTGFGNSNRTLDIWFKVVAFASSGTNRLLTLAGNSITDAAAFSLGYKTSGSTLEVSMGGAPYDCSIILPAISLDVWYNVTAAIAGNTLYAYNNGSFYASDTNSGAIESDVFLQIARYNSNYNQNANCKIASIKVYSRTLSAAEVNKNFNSMRVRFGV